MFVLSCSQVPHSHELFLNAVFSPRQLRNKCRALQDDWGFRNGAKSAYKQNINFMCLLHVILET